MPRVPGEPYPHGAAEVVLLAVNEVDEADGGGVVRDFVDLVAVLSPGGVHRKVLYSAHPEHQVEEIDAAVGRLMEASLLAFSLDGDVVIMHRLVQRVLRDRRQREGRLTSVMARAAATLRSLLPEDAVTLKEFPSDDEWNQR